VFVVSVEVELGVGNGGVVVAEDEGEGGRKVTDDDDGDGDEQEEEGVALKTGGQGGKVRDESMMEEGEPVDDDAVSVMLKSELVELRLDDGVGMLKVKLEGKSKVMEDGTSGTDEE
jgi:hypothetical protein